MSEPSPNGSNGRASNGRFAPGWKGGPGNPHSKEVAILRAIVLEVCTPERYRAAVEAVMRKAEEGDLRAFAEISDRSMGKPIPVDVNERLEALEATALGGANARN